MNTHTPAAPNHQPTPSLASNNPVIQPSINPALRSPRLPLIRQSTNPSIQLLATLLTLLALTACTASRPLKGGRALTAPAPTGGISQTLAQGDNPSQPTTQHQETIKVRSYTLPAGTVLAQSEPPSIQYPAASIAAAPSPSIAPSTIHYQLSTPLPVIEREETRATTELGAAQKDTARELGAKLSSLKGIVWLGIALFLFGLASLVWPPLKAIVASVTTSAALILGGLALMILPTLIVGNELLILAGVALLVSAWFLAHRHGELRGQLAAAAPAPTLPRPTASLTLQTRARSS